MPTLRAIRQSYDAAKGLSSLWHVQGFIDEHVFLTTSGAVGIAFRLAAVDYEGLDVPQRKAITDRFEGALRMLDGRFRIYQYLVKSQAPSLEAPYATQPTVAQALRARVEDLNARVQARYVVDLYFVLLYEPASAVAIGSTLTGVIQDPIAALKNWLSPAAVIRLASQQVWDAVAVITQTARALEAHLADGPALARMAKHDTFRFLCSLVEYAAPHVGLRDDAPVNYQMARSGVRFHTTHLEVGPAFVKVLTMKATPSRSFSHLLEPLYTRPGTFIVCLEWSRIPDETIRPKLLRHQKAWNNKRRSPLAYVAMSQHATADDLLHDDSAKAMSDQLGAMTTAIEVEGHFAGACSLTVVVYDRTLAGVQKTVAEMWTVLAKHDGAFLDEVDNRLRAWAAIVPGGSAWNVRYLELLETNLADLSLLLTLDQGEPDGAVAVFETRHGTLYHHHLSPNGDDTRHTLVLGATGSGKSFLLNFLLMHLQRFHPQTVVFDMGHSYRNLATALGGSYVTLGLDSAVTVNPFAFEPTEPHLHFLHQFCRLLVNGPDFALTREQDQRLFDAITHVYLIPDRSMHRLLTVAQMVETVIPHRFDDWVNGGRFASVFDNVEDTLDMSPFQVFEFGALKQYPALLEPVQFYCLHRTEARLTPERVTICVMDELELLLQQPTLRGHVERAMPGWRKANGVMILATQHVEALTDSHVLQKVVESCPTTMFLPNPLRDRATYARVFRLNEQELDLLDRLQRKREVLLKREGFAKVLNLTVSPREAAIYGNPVKPMEAERQLAAEGVTR